MGMASGFATGVGIGTGMAFAEWVKTNQSKIAGRIGAATGIGSGAEIMSRLEASLAGVALDLPFLGPVTLHLDGVVIGAMMAVTVMLFVLFSWAFGAGRTMAAGTVVALVALGALGDGGVTPMGETGHPLAAEQTVLSSFQQAAVPTPPVSMN